MTRAERKGFGKAGEPSSKATCNVKVKGGERDKKRVAAERDEGGNSRKGGKAQWAGWNEKPGPSQLSG